MRGLILALCVVGAAAAASAPAAPTTSYGSCEKKSAYDDGERRRESRPRPSRVASPSDARASIPLLT